MKRKTSVDYLSIQLTISRALLVDLLDQYKILKNKIIGKVFLFIDSLTYLLCLTIDFLSVHIPYIRQCYLSFHALSRMLCFLLFLCIFSTQPFIIFFKFTCKLGRPSLTAFSIWMLHSNRSETLYPVIFSRTAFYS